MVKRYTQLLTVLSLVSTVHAEKQLSLRERTRIKETVLPTLAEQAKTATDSELAEIVALAEKLQNECTTSKGCPKAVDASLDKIQDQAQERVFAVSEAGLARRSDEALVEIKTNVPVVQKKRTQERNINKKKRGFFKKMARRLSHLPRNIVRIVRHMPRNLSRTVRGS